jgi:hypothetical protein
MRKKNYYNYKIIAAAVLVLSLCRGCSDIFEDNIEKDKVVLIAPTDNVVSKISTQKFLWQKVEGATRYNFQIVSVRFDSIVDFILDADTSATTITVNLYPGQFQWRVKAYNSGYETPYTTFSLRIDSSIDLSRNTVNYTNPLNGKFLKDTFINFAWDKMYNAEYFVFQIRKDNKSGSVIETDTIADNSLNVGLAEGTYYWMVNAFNATSSTNNTTSWSLVVDKTPPASPALSQPSDSVLLTSDTVTFSWTRADKSASINCDSLYIFKTNSIYTNGALYAQLASANQTYDAVVTDNGFYTWYVKTADKAGNISEASESRKFRK